MCQIWQIDKLHKQVETFIVEALIRFLNWATVKCGIFNDSEVQIYYIMVENAFVQFHICI